MVFDHPEYRDVVERAVKELRQRKSELLEKALGALQRFPEGLTWSYRNMNRSVSVLTFNPFDRDIQFTTIEAGNIKGNPTGHTSCAEKNGLIGATIAKRVLAGMVFVGAPDPQDYAEGQVPEFLFPCDKCCSFVPYGPWILLDGLYVCHNQLTGQTSEEFKIRDAFKLPEPQMHPEFLSLLEARAQLREAS